MDKYEWSESGLELLNRIAGFVLKNGGNMRCALEIEREWMNPYLLEKSKFTHRNLNLWSQTEIQFLQANLHLTYEDIALQMKDRSEDAVRYKIYWLQKKGMLKGKWQAKKDFNLL
jgi:hypothetical protein